MRICKICQIEKELDQYHKKGNGHQYTCKECRKDYIRKHYIENKDRYKAKSKEAKKRLVTWMDGIRENLKCQECHENHPACLDFHHTDPDEKDFNIANYKHFSKEKIEEEIKKCIILCSNCHRKLHWKERQAK